jgi:hypothetical protein
MRRNVILSGGVAVAVLSGIAAALGAIEPDSFIRFDDPAIRYDQAPVNDPVARLGKQIEAGQVKLTFDENGPGYLASLLKSLNISVDSQMLVFSKTSFQSPKIDPKNPRAVFFNDTVSVGSVQNSDVLELASLDPRQGVVFYTLQNSKDEKPEFERRDVCLQCHQGLNTLGVPGILVSSVYPAADGMPAFRGQQRGTDHRSPLDERWGGWYVTGTHGEERHLGNAVGHDSSNPTLLDTFGTQNLTSLSRKVDLNRPTYLAKTSDIVALMTLEHQTRMTNLMTRAGWEARILERKPDPELAARVESDIDALVTYMVFADEAQLHDPIKGVSTFTESFQQRGPRDKQGRSLRDFDLQTRMFKYPLSYMIYSEAFDNMPETVRDRVYRKLYDVLTEKNTDKKFERLSAADRRAALEILRETKPNLPEYFRSPEGPVIGH